MVYNFGLGGIVKFGTHVANGNTTTYNIAHGVGATPDYAFIFPASNHAAVTPSYISAIDGTNITVTYTATTTAGTNNISIRWFAGTKYSVRAEINAVIGDTIPDE